MPLAQSWFCCRCSYGPLNYEIDAFCPNCQAERCSSCSIQFQHLIYRYGNSGPPDIHRAARENDIDTVLQLLEIGANVNEKTSNSNTPLHIAIEHKHLDMITVLLERGADVNIPGNYGVTTLMLALQRGLHDVVEKLLQAGATLKGSILQQVATVLDEERLGKVVEIRPSWNAPQFIQQELSGRAEGLREVITLTGSVRNAQMMSCKDYVAQTWGDSELVVLDTLIEALKTGHAVSDLSDGPFLTTGCYSWVPSRGQYFRLSVQDYSMDGYLDKPCLTNILQKATLAVGFPVRDRPDGIGLEIPFPLLLRFADISVSMEYDNGTILVGESAILFPSRKLSDGIQWHIANATSAQEAVQVIAQSPDWIRTQDIGHLAELRAYLGYYSQARVLLGTRELVLSQSTAELSSQLPKTKSQIEMAHEGTMGAGFSIQGIFNTTVGGKWIVPTRFNVSLEGNRDVEDLLMNARRRPVLVYDRNEDRGWLVPELSLIAHMTLMYLHQSDVRERCLSTVQETLPYLTAVADGGLSAYEVVKHNWNFELYEKIEDGKMKTFGMVIRDFMKDLQKLRTAENVRRESKGWKLSLFSGRSLRGWDFSELAFKAENMFQREMKWENGGGPMWTMLGDTEDMVVILGSRLGNLIRPDPVTAFESARKWKTTPKLAGLLTATNSCVEQLALKRVLFDDVSGPSSKAESCIGTGLLSIQTVTATNPVWSFTRSLGGVIRHAQNHGIIEN
uniref:Ankyrin-3 n=1 Tax=Talaromyces marneffei PM1 TaxID=1077442 RepID=A0A093UL03_TALMA